MTPDEALSIVDTKAAGRTRYEGQEPRVDEVLAAEVRRQREEIAALRLTLGEQPPPANCPEPIGCPLPGACVTVRGIIRLRDLIGRVADELESHVRSYPLPTSDGIAAQRYERDMAIVREVREAVGKKS